MALARGGRRLALSDTNHKERALMLAIPLERLAYIIAKAREFDAEVPVEPDAATGSDGPDDDEREVLLDTPDNPTEAGIAGRDRRPRSARTAGSARADVARPRRL